MERLVGEMQSTINTAAQDNNRDKSAGESQYHTTVPSHLLDEAPTARLYHIQPLPGNGQGMIVAINIPEGTRVLSEAPTIRIPSNPQDQAGARRVDRMMIQQLSKLDTETRQRFYALHNKWGSEFPRAVGITKTNALPLGHNSREAGIFLDASRINHACKNNAENTWNAALSKLSIHAVRDIPAGEEIAISYVAGFQGYEDRQLRLYKAFGFHCDCERCSLSAAGHTQSDQRRKRLVSLEEEISDGVGIVATPVACLRKVRQMLRLLREEETSEATIVRVYYDAFRVAIANGDQARARVFARRWYESRVVVEGGDSEDSVRAKALAEKPSSHRLYGTTMKWKQAVGKVPRGLGEKEFGNWLWRDKGAA